MKEETTELKLRLRKGAQVYSHILTHLKSCEKIELEIIPFSKVFKKLCSLLSIPKNEAWELLHFLHDMSIITIVTNHGIVINYDIKDNKLEEKIYP